MEKRERYMEFLREEGYQPKLDPDGDIHFKKEGSDLWLFANEDDEPYFQMILPLYQVDDDADIGTTVAAAASVTGQMKGAKVFIAPGNWCVASIEQFLASPSDLPVLFDRFLTILFATRQQMAEELSRLKEDAAVA